MDEFFHHLQERSKSTPFLEAELTQEWDKPLKKTYVKLCNIASQKYVSQAAALTIRVSESHRQLSKVSSQEQL